MAKLFPFAFSPDGTNKEEFIRVLEHISLRLHKMPEHPGDDPLHDVRTMIKLLRSLLWLARPELTQATYDSAKKSLRDAAEKLSGPRDASVIRTLLEELHEEASKAREREALHLAKEKLTPPEKHAAHARALVNQSSALVQKTIREVLEKASAVDEWQGTKRRLKKAFAQTTKAHKIAKKQDEPLAYHEWRKKAKRLLYLLQVLSDKPDRSRRQTIKSVDQLQHDLGDYHDSVVLQEKLEEKFSGGSSKVEPVLKLLRKQQRRLRKKAGRIARKIEL